MGQMDQKSLLILPQAVKALRRPLPRRSWVPWPVRPWDLSLLSDLFSPAWPEAVSGTASDRRSAADAAAEYNGAGSAAQTTPVDAVRPEAVFRALTLDRPPWPLCGQNQWHGAHPDPGCPSWVHAGRWPLRGMPPAYTAERFPTSARGVCAGRARSAPQGRSLRAARAH